MLDANLLLLLVIGETDESEIDHKKRVQTYDVADYRALQAFLENFLYLYITPNILTEVSNLLGRKPKGGSTFDLTLARFIREANETYVASADAIHDPAFVSFDVADTASKIVASRGKLLLTDDYRLANHLNSAGLAAVNFNHIRPLL
ncbi:hypothetical protein CKO28_23195 [Rhodovibrio sodomensis]|uniref:PIN domain-containing protein n=1 Tax=Rhodovibrio sodomensis TaxID=1088 RepID=A0ABS1DLC3_9PROT|nr:hypothetical protein [Rhodovibrio sodomensis]MBK1670922.1 hypothetical protein [Rhodovibrio sodomensis]